MKKIFSCTILLFFVICFNPIGSYGTDYWGKNYLAVNYRYSSYRNMMQQTSDGGYIASMGISFVSSGDFSVLKIDSNGTVGWHKAYGGIYDESPTYIQPTTDGGYIITGNTHLIDNNYYNEEVWVLKLDCDGEIIWQKVYLVDLQDSASCVQQTHDGGYIVTGYTHVDGYGYGACWLLKLDSAGNIQWQKAYEGATGVYPDAIQQTDDDGDGFNDDGYVVLGSTPSFGAGSFDVFVFKLDGSGNMTWQKVYGGLDAEQTSWIQQTDDDEDGFNDDGYIVSGYTDSFGAGGRDAWVLKISSNGNVAWAKSYGSSGHENSNFILQTTDGGYILAVDHAGLILLKLSNSGDITWQKAYYGSSADSVLQTTDGGYIAAGCDGSSLNIYKLDSEGNIPGCNIGTGDLIASNTLVEGQDSGAILKITSATPIDTTVSPQIISTHVITFCCHDTDDSDGDGVGDNCDNCVSVSNPLQEDSYPPCGNGIGDACECEGDLDHNGVVNTLDNTIFMANFGRENCTDQTPCDGDFDCDGNVDEDDQAIFNEDFNRTDCPIGSEDPYCIYQDPDCDGVLSDGDNSGTSGDNPCTGWEIANCDDNCPNHPNGPYGGTCIYGGEPCMSGNECETDEFCSMHQEDFDGDGVGDACGGSISGTITCENCSGYIYIFALSEPDPDFSNWPYNLINYTWINSPGSYALGVPYDTQIWIYAWWPENQINPQLTVSPCDYFGSYAVNPITIPEGSPDPTGINIHLAKVCESSDECTDGLYCNGIETCVDQLCKPGENPCPGQSCNEGADSCITVSTTTPTSIRTTTTTIPECETDDDCENDGAFCNGDEICLKGRCRSAGTPCPDDEEFCNGEESCDEESNKCVSSGGPCSEPTPICSEEQNACVECLNNVDCDNGSFCDGTEVCEDRACQSGSNPCKDNEECDEANDRCVPKPVPCSINIEPETKEVISGQTASFNVTTEGDCSTPNYEWSVESTIGSKIDQNGNYTAGLNLDLANPANDKVKVVDRGNSDAQAEATVTVSLCPSVQLYGEQSKEVKALRNFRDSVLSTTPEGQELIKLYYEWSPAIVRAMEEDEEFREDVKEMIDGVLIMIREAVEQAILHVKSSIRQSFGSAFCSIYSMSIIALDYLY